MNYGEQYPTKSGKNYNSNVGVAPKKSYNKNSSASSGSDSDSSARSDFSGFKIVSNGSILVNEVEEESSYTTFVKDEQKYAGSLMTMGPSANAISLPGFLEEEFGEN